VSFKKYMTQNMKIRPNTQEMAYNIVASISFEGAPTTVINTS
jgi:hypothetical protein